MTITNAQPIPLWSGETPGISTAEPPFQPTITPYVLNGATPGGCVIVCPGGAYVGRAPHEGEPIALALNDRGIAACVCDYRVAPYRHPYPLLDAQRAIRWVRANAAQLNVDPAAVGILGFSAGGHLVSTAGTHYDTGRVDGDELDRQSCRPDAIVLCYPVISFGEFGHVGSKNNLLGENPPEVLVQSLSNETQVTADTPPAFLWHTADDPGVLVQNSLLFAQALSAHGVPYELHVYRSGRHGLGLAPEFPHIATWMDLCAEWLKEIGF
ncbi:MAG TPA: alpha/beta hydrolase [Armatimonadetes bacterium]|nr:alpha/beta hydrolase [Armatimonadota bacterium]